MKEHWLLDPTITFLNHGSFGAAPKVILAKQNELRTQLEREPVRFMVRELEPLLDDARAALAEFVGADRASIAFMPNATAGVNAVLRSLDLDRHDELLVTSARVQRVAQRAGIRGRSCRRESGRGRRALPDPLLGRNRRTHARHRHRHRLLLIDHVTSRVRSVTAASTRSTISSEERIGKGTSTATTFTPAMPATYSSALRDALYSCVVTSSSS